MALLQFAFLAALSLGSAWGDRFQSVGHKSVPDMPTVIEEENEAIGNEAASEEQRAATDEELGTAKAVSSEQGADAKEELGNPEITSFEQRAAPEEELGTAEEQDAAAEELGTAEEQGAAAKELGPPRMTIANAALKALAKRVAGGAPAVANRIPGVVRNYGAGRGGAGFSTQGVGAVRGYGTTKAGQDAGLLNHKEATKKQEEVEKFNRMFMQMSTMDIFF